MVINIVETVIIIVQLRHYLLNDRCKGNNSYSVITHEVKVLFVQAVGENDLEYSRLCK